MTTWLTRFFAGLLLVLPFLPAVAGDPDDEQIARLVKQLGSSDYRMRDTATKRLKELGEPAADALVRAMKSNDVEARRRAEAILTQIGEPALDALNKAATGDDLETRRRAEQVVAVIQNKLYPELILTGHTSHVWRVCVSADGKRLLTCSEDKTLRLWDTHTGKQLRVFEGHTGQVEGAALSPDGKRVLSGSSDKTMRLWDATTDKELRKFECPTGVLSVAFGPEGQALSGGSDCAMQLQELDSGKKAGVFAGHTGRVRDVAYSEKAKLAATCSYGDQPIRLWDLDTGKEVRQLSGGLRPGDASWSVCFAPDGKRLLSANTRGTLQMWDVQTGKELKQIQAHKPHSLCAAFSPDGKLLVSGGCDNTVRVWDAATGKELRKYEGHTGIVTSVAFFPDGRRIASASGDGTARIWRAPR